MGSTQQIGQCDYVSIDGRKFRKESISVEPSMGWFVVKAEAWTGGVTAAVFAHRDREKCEEVARIMRNAWPGQALRIYGDEVKVRASREGGRQRISAEQLQIRSGQKVLVTLDNGQKVPATAKSDPWQLGHGDWVIRLDLPGICGGYDLGRVEVVKGGGQ